jgi:hypothetical protein
VAVGAQALPRLHEPKGLDYRVNLAAFTRHEGAIAEHQS